MRRLRLVASLFVLLLPNWLKIPVLRAFGSRIGKGCYIGFSILNVSRIDLGDHVRIGHFNLIHSLSELVLETGSKIESMNWISGGGKGKLLLGRNASIRRLHALECSGTVQIGANSILAGRGTLIYTHSAAPREVTVTRGVSIGDWCYIGAAARFLPGASVAKGTFVGMGAVVARQHGEEYVVLAGSPAAIRRQLSPDEPYFERPFKAHGHHPEGYKG